MKHLVAVRLINDAAFHHDQCARNETLVLVIHLRTIFRDLEISFDVFQIDNDGFGVAGFLKIHFSRNDPGICKGTGGHYSEDHHRIIYFSHLSPFL